MHNVCDVLSYILWCISDMNDEATFSSAAKTVEDIVGEAGLNMIINNAAVSNRASLETVTSEDMVSLFQVNAVGPLMLTKVCEFL